MKATEARQLAEKFYTLETVLLMIENTARIGRSSIEIDKVDFGFCKDALTDLGYTVISDNGGIFGGSGREKFTVTW